MTARTHLMMIRTRTDDENTDGDAPRWMAPGGSLELTTSGATRAFHGMKIIIKRKDADAPTEDGASQEYMIFRQVIE